jgi:hypothetical protein
MMWREIGLADIARRAIGWHLSEEQIVQNAFDDVSAVSVLRSSGWADKWGFGIA